MRVDTEGWEDVRPKAAVAANVGAGPDIIICHDTTTRNMYPEKLVDVYRRSPTISATSTAAGIRSAKAYGTHDEKKWVGDPLGAPATWSSTATAMLKAAGFDTVPKDIAGFLKLCQGAEGKGNAGRFRARQRDGRRELDHWLVWAHGGRLVDAKNNVVINSPETIAALEYAKELYETFIPGTLSWLDPNNNKAFLDGQISVTDNGISIYYAAQDSQDPKLKEMADDIKHAEYPVGPVGVKTAAASRLQPDDLQVHKVPEGGKGIPRGS